MADQVFEVAGEVLFEVRMRRKKRVAKKRVDSVQPNSTFGR
jgi:hypothetical protein